LVEALGGKVIQCNFLLQLLNLKGAAKLNGYQIKSLVSF